MRIRKLVLAISCFWLSCADFSHAGLITIFDGTFNGSDWSLTTIGTDSGHTVALSKETSGGDPGDYQQMQFYLSSDSSTGVAGLAFFTAETYNPHADGAITSIDFSDDHFQTADLVGSFVLMQNDIIYVWQSTAYFHGNTSWMPFSVSDLTASDFLSLSNFAHPDFSATGAPITFGYDFVRFSPPGTLDGGVDNWTVQIHTSAVPEPSSAILLGLAGVLAGAALTWRRRRSVA